MYDANSGYTAILKNLNTLGYRTKAGNNFGKNSLYGILRNCKYKPRNFHKIKDESEVISIPGGVQAIVSVEMFDRIQKRYSRIKQLKREKDDITDIIKNIVRAIENGFDDD